MPKGTFQQLYLDTGGKGALLVEINNKSPSQIKYGLTISLLPPPGVNLRSEQACLNVTTITSFSANNTSHCYNWQTIFQRRCPRR